MTRTPLPTRRAGLTTEVTHHLSSGSQTFEVTFNFAEDKIVEVFCSSGKTGTDVTAILTDGCILISKLLQFGDSIESIASSLGENRQEGEKIGPPSSILGAVARCALNLTSQPS